MVWIDVENVCLYLCHYPRDVIFEAAEMPLFISSVDVFSERPGKKVPIPAASDGFGFSSASL
jgi:hypothetical protein